MTTAIVNSPKASEDLDYEVSLETEGREYIHKTSWIKDPYLGMAND